MVFEAGITDAMKPYLVSVGIRGLGIHFHFYFHSRRKWKLRWIGNHLVITSYKIVRRAL
jgi:hypothetical protein